LEKKVKRVFFHPDLDSRRLHHFQCAVQALSPLQILGTDHRHPEQASRRGFTTAIPKGPISILAIQKVLDLLPELIQNGWDFI
jgi:hypothetical protein